MSIFLYYEQNHFDKSESDTTFLRFPRSFRPIVSHEAVRRALQLAMGCRDCTRCCLVRFSLRAVRELIN